MALHFEYPLIEKYGSYHFNDSKNLATHALEVYMQ